MSYPIPDGARCERAVLHDFVLIREYPDALIETCKNCGKRVIYNRKHGLNERQYREDHLRHTLQPYGPTGDLFRQIYGTSSIKEWEEVVRMRREKPTTDQIMAEVRSDLKTMQRTSVNIEKK